MKRLAVLTIALVAAVFGQSVETIPYRVNLSSLNEVPAISGDPSSGAATVLLHLVRDASGGIVSGSVDFRVNYRLASAADITMMHIHRGSASVNGGVVIDSGMGAAIPGAVSGTIRSQGQAMPSSATALTALRDIVADPSGFYLNLHTSRNPAGEMRGQLMQAETLVLAGLMSPDNEVPAITGLAASAVGSVTVIASRTADGVPTSAEIIFDANYTGFPEGTNFTGFHIHAGAQGVNGPVVINTGLAGPLAANVAGGNLHYEVQADPASLVQTQSIFGLFTTPQALYINLHTQANPGGAVRSQLRNTDRMTFQSTLLPSNEVPALTGLEASAPAAFTMHTLRNDDGSIVAGVTVFDANFRFPSATQFTGMHIHEGAAGVNGPVVINSGLAAANQPNSETGFGNLYRMVTQSSAAALRAMNIVAVDPSLTYFNVHTTVNPGGAVRAPTAAAPGVPAVTAVISGVSDPALRTVAPLGLMTIFGSSLFSAPSGYQAFGTQAPQHLNGTSVTVGGKNAALVTLGRVPSYVPTDFIVAQVPADAVNGTQPVVVTSSGGTSRPMSVNVATVAPALYFDQIGGVAFHVENMTLIGPGNPALQGEPIAILATGLGVTFPTATTGTIPGAADLLLAQANPTVSIGGRPASVTGAGLVPGFVGFYLVIATVPQGVTGTVPVTVSQSAAGLTTPVQSNTVMLTVR